MWWKDGSQPLEGKVGEQLSSPEGQGCFSVKDLAHAEKTPGSESQTMWVFFLNAYH